jgi:hypothetical protein
MEKLSTSVTEYLRADPFGFTAAQKEDQFLGLINRLTAHHAELCPDYSRIIRPLFPAGMEAESLSEVPFIPVRLFKLLDLSSIPVADAVRTMTSSGTTGQQVSRIYLDKETSTAQTRALTQIMGSVLGKSRMPMLVVDSSAVIKDRTMFSARGAGIRGFSMFGKDIEYAFDENMNLRTEEINRFLEKHDGSPVFLFGFTFMVWEHLCEELRRRGKVISIPSGILLHGGGWKKLASLNISNDEFRSAVRDTTGVQKVVNYYGMVEQTGSIFVECDEGYLHSSSYSEIIVRDPVTYKVVANGSEGVIQVVSVLPMSYPGHSILTEDMGTVVGNDDCRCGRPGRYFVISGRIKDAEVRGCSDTFAA